MDTILESVGLRGTNRPQDVKLVQTLLNKNGFPQLQIDGICGNNTTKAIITYQKHFYHHPDGLVSPGKKTFSQLSSGQRSALPRAHGSTGSNPNGARKNPMTMYPSYQVLKLMMQYEQLHTLPYDDHSSHTISSWTAGATIGYGHWISRQSEFDQFKDGISESAAETLFSQDLKKFVDAVRQYAKVALTQNEFDALVMLAFNIGTRDNLNHKGLYYSTALKVINGESPEDLDRAWMQFVYSRGVRMKGLVNRRKSELNVYHKGIYIKL